MHSIYTNLFILLYKTKKINIKFGRNKHFTNININYDEH